MNYISYNQICEILKVDINNPRYNPKKYETILEHIEEINALIKNKEVAEEIVNFAQIGEFSLIKYIECVID